VPPASCASRAAVRVSWRFNESARVLPAKISVFMRCIGAYFFSVGVCADYFLLCNSGLCRKSVSRETGFTPAANNAAMCRRNKHLLAGLLTDF
jgi:hypothetical protein